MKKADKIRVAIDTNLLISAIIASGNPYTLLQTWKNNKFTLILSPRLLKEITDTSQKGYLQKYHLFSDKIIELILALRHGAEIVTSASTASLPVHYRDTKDDYLLAVALGGNADYLITGDKDLLVLNGNPALGKLKIITVKEFLILI